MLITKEVEIELHSRQITYYKNLGYDVPRIKDKYSRYTTPKGTKIIVKVEDLQKGSHVDIQYKCDICGEPVTCNYKTYVQSQINSFTKIDACDNCKTIKSRMSIKEKYGVDNILLLPEIREKSYDKNRHSYEFIYNEFDKIGYILITQNYQNNIQPLDYICKKHMEYGVQITNYANIKHHGSACRLCANERISDLQRNSFEHVKDEYINLGYNLLSNENEYIDCHTPLRCSCTKHPNEFFNITLVHARRHQEGCKICLQDKISGENNPNWKGGITSLSQYLRYKTKYWIFDSLKNTKFKCAITNIENHNLVVHHLYSFSKIVEEVLENTGMPLYPQVSLYSIEQLNILENKCLELHYQKGWGVPLIKPLHNLFHSQMGSIIIDNGEFQEFTQRYYNFEFDELLEEKYKYKNIILKKTG
ncbi:MAG: hypothetical protein M0P49_01460 [Bacilli bacterium]|nr:hypothetical protein [Bacilli bacterium]